MIVIMMNANHILARLSSLKNEMSDLRVANALYCNRKGYTALEKSASALRRDRLVEIKLELSLLLRGRKVDLRTARDSSRYFRDEVVRTAQVQYEAG